MVLQLDERIPAERDVSEPPQLGLKSRATSIPKVDNDGASAVVHPTKHSDGERHSSLKQPGVRPSQSMPPYIKDLYRTRLLERDEEVDLFTRLAHLRSRSENLLAEVADTGEASDQQSSQLEANQSESIAIRNRIVEANLRLVVSIARQFVRQFNGVGQPDLFELISDGNEILLRAVDRFDVQYGTRFSTYATTAVRRQLFRVGKSAHQRYQRFVTGTQSALALEHDRKSYPSSDIHAAQKQQRDVRVLLGELVDRERVIVEGRFGFGDDNRRLTFRELGEKLGVSKERVRQLHDRAMNQLVTAAEHHRIDAFDD